LDGIPPSDGREGEDNDFGNLVKSKVKARMKGRNPLRSHSRN
jgi:hypothetical protein